jgi:signal transduction histidine kinase/CheY-like chemotaxis protein
MAALLTKPESFDHVDSMLTDLRQELFNLLLLPTAAAPLYLTLLMKLFFDQWFLSNTVTIISVFGVCFIAYRLKARWPRLAAYLYVGGLAVVIFGLAWVWAAPLSLVLLPALVLLSIAILNTGATIVIAVLASLLILAPVTRHEPTDITATICTITAVWLTVILAWLKSRNQITALEWAWNSYCQAHVATEEAQQHRAELMRLYKTLDEAYYRLERSNVQLAHARDEAEEARRVKQQFVANVSHELRTPLNIIIGFSEAMALSPESYGVKTIPRQLMGDINRIYRSARHLKSLIDDVLDLSQIDARHMPLLIEQTALSQIIIEATDMIKGIVTRKGLTISLDIPETLPLLFLDRLRIRQVLLNLLSNAVRFTDTGGMTVSVQSQPEWLQVTVADTGAGIAPENLEKVFEEFQQLDTSLNKRYDGTGLGLALSRRFIELHGGRLWAESELGQGSRFYFTLPLTPGTATPDLIKSALPISAHAEARVGRTIVVAAEEAMAVNFLKRYLRNYHIRSVSQRDLTEAIQTYLPHAVITSGCVDLLAGTEAGTQLAAIAQEIGVPIISCPLPDPGHLSRALGVDHYLVKPITRECLLSVLAGYSDRVKRILIIDDDAQLVELMARLVRAAPAVYTVDIACGGEEGLTRIREFQPDLVLLDLMMPTLDGFSILEAIRADEQLRDIAVIMITARDLPKTEIRLPGQNRINIEGLNHFTLTETLNCLQAVLDALPLPRLHINQNGHSKMQKSEG